jgi:hypothetical protein
MFCFSLGTAPLMFALGAFGSLMSRTFQTKAMTAGALLVTVLGLVMFTNGWNLSGAAPPRVASGPLYGSRVAASAQVEGGVQVVETTLAPGRYQPIAVQAGLPVRWKLTAPPGSINGCNGQLVIPQYGIDRRLVSGENIIEFTPDQPGTFLYSCWMGMIRSTITVAEADSEMMYTDGVQTFHNANQ